MLRFSRAMLAVTTFVLLGTGLAGAASVARRRKRQAADTEQA